jgi:hypothetical protein
LTVPKESRANKREGGVETRGKSAEENDRKEADPGLAKERSGRGPTGATVLSRHQRSSLSSVVTERDSAAGILRDDPAGCRRWPLKVK